MLIRVQDLHKSFGANHVLKGVELTVERDKSLVILGGSGAGKSVLFRHLVGLIQPDRGSVVVDDVDLKSLNRKDLFHFRRRFGMSFQEGALFDSMTTFENVAFPIRRWEPKLSKSELTNRVESCLELVGLSGIGKRMPSELSGGMRRRVGFARAIALKPEILLFDEPTTGLDPIMTSVLNNIIRNLGDQLGVTTITITHDLSSAKTIADQVAMLFRGSVILEQDTQSFFATDNPIVQQFLEGRAEGPATETIEPSS